MKVLIDENLPWELRSLLVGHEAFTVAYQGWSGVKNGELLAKAAASGFEIFLTMDRRIESERGKAGLPLSVVLVRAATNRMVHIAPLVAAILSAIENLPPRTLVVVQG